MKTGVLPDNGGTGQPAPCKIGLACVLYTKLMSMASASTLSALGRREEMERVKTQKSELKGMKWEIPELVRLSKVTMANGEPPT